MNISQDKITVLPLTEDRAEPAARLESEALGREAWSAEAIKETIALNGRYFAAFINGEFAGHGGFTFAADEGYITNIAVDRKVRRQGVAVKLVEAMCGCAKELGLSFLSLEVRESNEPAIRLYEKTGFTVRGKRPSFYSAPDETAIIMTKDI